MKSLSMLVILGLCTIAVTPAIAGDVVAKPTGCQAKTQGINDKIAVAKKQGNTYQISGLEKALSEAQGCSDASLKAERESKVSKAKQEVAERQSDLDTAIAKGDVKKINTRKEKLAASREELQGAIDELNR